MTLSGRKLAGSSDKDRPENDFYPTPAWATEALLSRVEFKAPIIWEPAVGDGAMAEVIEKHLSAKQELVFSDIVYYGYHAKKGLNINDFLAEDSLLWDSIKARDKPVSVITNPPFILGKEFVERCKQVSHHRFALFLKLTFLESMKRYDLLRDKDFPLAQVHVFSNRVTLHRNGIPTPDKNGKINGGTAAYAWFVWDNQHNGPPELHLIDDKEPKK